jgi:isoquinoline 1-oxidoreductase beta subunit
MTRRTFIEILGLSSVGLYFGYYALATKLTSEPTGTLGKKPTTASPAEEGTSSGLNPNVFLHLSPEGLVTIVCHRSEMGQGIRSSLPVLLADELGADMKRVKIVQADGDKAYGDQNTDGSNSVRSIYEDMRKAAATARMMLISAAAARLKVPENSLEAKDHFIIHQSTGQKIGFGDLAIEAGKQSLPKPNQVKLRPVSELRHVGKLLPLIDGPAFVNGTARFGADVRLPNQLIAVIARPPVVGAKIKHYNKKAALAVANVKHVIELPHPTPPYSFQPFGGVAVIAENTWAAMKGRDTLEITWTPGPNGNYTSSTYRETLFSSVRKPGKTMRNVGDVDAALKSATQIIEAEYYVPHLAHVPMEPPAAIASYNPEKGGSCEVWAPTQNPQAAKTEVARALGLGEDRIIVQKQRSSQKR